MAAEVFFVGSLALFVFGVKLGWVPLAGTRTYFATAGGPLEAVRDVAHHLALPAFVLGLQFATSQYLNMRASMVGELGSDYLLAGRAKGLRERRIKYGYAARTALLPVIAVTGVHTLRASTCWDLGRPGLPHGGWRGRRPGVVGGHARRRRSRSRRAG